jgi:hypothetical protein
MSEKRPWATKSAAHRFGFCACPACNPKALPQGELGDVPCAWCWNEEEKTHRRWVLRAKAEEWAKEHGMTEDDITTSPEARSALAHPPPLPGSGDKVPDTEPAPPPYVPLKREDPDE